MTKPVHANRADAKKAGWFSRRHETDAAHRAAVDTYQHKKLVRKAAKS